MTTGFFDPTLGTLVVLYGAVYLVGLALGAVAWVGGHLAGLDRDRVALGLAGVIVAAGAAKYGWDVATGGWADADWVQLLAVMAAGAATVPVLGRIVGRVREAVAAG